MQESQCPDLKAIGLIAVWCITLVQCINWADGYQLVFMGIDFLRMDMIMLELTFAACLICILTVYFRVPRHIRIRNSRAQKLIWKNNRRKHMNFTEKAELRILIEEGVVIEVPDINEKENVWCSKCALSNNAFEY